jgi:hypothetical protein
MSANWNHFLKWADLWAGSITDGREDYKTLIVDRVKEAREAFTSGGDWKPLLKKSFFTDNNLLHWHPRSTLFLVAVQRHKLSSSVEEAVV